MSTNSILLTKAISSLHTTPSFLRDDSEPNPQPPLNLNSPLVFLSPDFALTEEEDVLLKDIIYQSKLTPNVTLFDLLFFDLHKQLSSLKQFVVKNDFDREIELLESCYAGLIENRTKDTAQLKHFLNTLVLSLIKSNNALNKAADGTCQSIKASGETQLIIKILSRRVALFKKFETSPACHSQLFDKPLSQLSRDERAVPLYLPETKKIFANNSLFLQIIFNALKKTNPSSTHFDQLTQEIIQLVASLGVNRTSNFLSANIDLSMYLNQHLSLLTEYGNSPYWTKIIHDSLPFYQKTIDKLLQDYELLQSKERDLEFQNGRLPILGVGPLDPHDILAEFRVQKMIEPSFQLTPSEAKLIKEISCCLFNDFTMMTMLDVLGFAIYDRLEKLKKIFPVLDGKIAETQGLVSSHCLLLYAGLFRSCPEQIRLLGAVNASSDIFTSSPRLFPKRIDQALGDFEKAVKETKLNSKTPTRNQLKALEANQNKILEQFRETVLPLRNLLVKLLGSKGHFYLLVQSASMYQKNKGLEQNNRIGRATIEKYWDYVKRGYQTGLKEGLIGIRYNFDHIMGTRLPFSENPSEKEISAFGLKIAKEIFLDVQILETLKKELGEAVRGNLNHEAWLAKKNCVRTLQKNQQEFIEMLFANLMFHKMKFSFLSDMLELIEPEVFPEGALTTYSCHLRLIYNIDKHLKAPIHSPSLLLPNTISSKFKILLDSIQTEFDTYQQLFRYARLSEDSEGGHFVYGTWLALLAPREGSIVSLFESSLQTLSALKLELLEDLRNKWSTLTLEELQKLNPSDIKEALFLEGVQLVRPILILSDCLALLQRRHFLEEAAIIPPELADVMQLDEIDEMYQTLIKAKIPALPAVAELAPTPASETPKQLPPNRVVPRKKPAPSRRAVPQQRKIVSSTTISMTSPSPAPEIRELVNLTKSYKVLEKLRELGFFEKRQKGSHHILKSPQGGTVVVPGNKSLPLGTRKEIAKQTAEALHQ